MTSPNGALDDRLVELPAGDPGFLRPTAEWDVRTPGRPKVKEVGQRATKSPWMVDSPSTKPVGNEPTGRDSKQAEPVLEGVVV